MTLFLNFRDRTSFGVDKIVIHKDYHFGDDDHDMAIMILSEKAKVSNYIYPICLPTVSAALKPGRKCVLSGMCIIASV